MVLFASHARIACAASCLVALSCTQALAADAGNSTPTTAGPQVTIIGTRSTTAPGVEAARAAAARVPGGANVVSSEEYEDRRASNLQDLFSLSPGVFVQPRFGAEEARLSIRGSGLQRTYHMRGINLLQDGIPLTLADGSADFQAIEPMALSHAEVLRGANALEYGATTLGGAVNFVSPSGYDAPGLRARVEAGSFGYQRGLVGVGGVQGAADYFISASAYSQDGFRDWSRQKGARLFGNTGLKLSDTTETRLFAALVHSDSQLPGSLTRAQLAERPSTANANSLAGRQKRDFDLYRFANRTVIDVGGGRLALSAGYSHKSLWHPIFQALQQRSDDYSMTIRYIDDTAIAGHRNRLVLGASPSWNTLHDDRFANVAGGRGGRTAESLQRSRNLVLYAQDELSLNDAWTLVAGMQWSHAQRRSEDRFMLDGDQSLAVSYRRASPKLALLWQPNERWSIFGNLSDSFEPPSFGELSGGLIASRLQAQSARTVELGTRGQIPHMQWDVTAYAARVRNELLSLNTPDGQPLGTVNAPRTIHRGVEAGVELDLTTALSWRSSYLWSELRFDHSSTYGNGALPGIPGHFYRGELAWAVGRTYRLALACEASSAYAIDMARTLHTDSHVLWGLRFARDVERGISWFVDARNLANRRYAATTGVIADARGRDVAQFMPGDGRAVYFGVDWRVGK